MMMIVVWSTNNVGLVHGNGIAEEEAEQFSAMYVFGDSLTDNGNNNYLVNSLAKANYIPYGVDYYAGPTGRFCNGGTIADFLGDLVGLPEIPPYASPFATGTRILKGVNYASAAAGILEETGQNLGDRFSLNKQVQNFQNTLNALKRQLGEKDLSRHLAKSLVVFVLGSNDYINNYLALQGFGLRKFLLAGIGPLGCIPSQLATGLAPPGECVGFTNDYVSMFNVQLWSMVDRLNANSSSGAIYVYGNTFGAFYDIINNPGTYGFSVADRGCCGIGRNKGQITCLPFSIPCLNRDQYVFWDAFHPTQAVNKILAQTAYSGSPSDCYPINVKQMAQI
ncbi:GDSL lipase/esterase [Dillenia turbinata]|uniref:GDSL lipase/esterase n=1 Tax=Dillenia turbinata TaxID=194707 RepID=A0AAN8UXF0_9MAGN